MCYTCNLLGINFHADDNDIKENIDALASNGTSYSLSTGETFSGSNISGLEPEQEIKINTKIGEKYFNIVIP